MKKKKVDLPFLILTTLLVLLGTGIFWSASLGLLARETSTYGPIVFKQIFMGLVPGIIIAYFLSKTNFELWRKWAFYILIGAILVNLIIFIPGLGLTHGGATRWLLIGSISFQTSELLKIGVLIYFAAWIASRKDRMQEWTEGFIPLCIMLFIACGLLLLQPDTDTAFVLSAGLIAMYIAGKGKIKGVLIIGSIGLLLLGTLIATRPYLQARVQTLLNPTENTLGSGYQINQSLIAIGSGGISGRGFGQSIQKFAFLPEPVGDSIFAVASEEFGFLGASLLVALFTGWTLRAYHIASRTPSIFGSMLMIGISSLIITQAFINISSMLGIIPIAGITLPLVSQGGTSLIFVLAQIGIMLSISRTSILKTH
jgi:cell division protein FtsW